MTDEKITLTICQEDAEWAVERLLEIAAAHREAIECSALATPLYLRTLAEAVEGLTYERGAALVAAAVEYAWISNEPGVAADDYEAFAAGLRVWAQQYWPKRPLEDT